MNSQSIHKAQRVLALFLTALFAMLVFIGPQASGESKTDSVTMSVGATQSLFIKNRNNSTKATINSSTSANSAIVTVTNTTQDFVLTAVSAGTTTVTLVTYDTSTNNSDTWTITVTVAGNTGTTRSVSINRGNSVSLDTFTSVESYVSSDTTIASVGYSNNVINATANAVGNCTITVVGTLSGNSSVQTYHYNITVSDSTINNSGSTNSSSVTLKSGQNAIIGQGGVYTGVSSYTSTNSNVATVSVSNNILTIAAVGQGSATITYVATLASTGQTVTYTIYVTVSGSVTSSGDYIETVPSSSSGLSIGVSERVVAEGKTYRLKGITMDGTVVAANELLWLSTDDTVISVNKTTGIFRANKTGTARLIAVDPLGRYHLTVAITVQ